MYKHHVPERSRTWTTEKAALGKRLFVDPKLSQDGTVSCASCHNAALGFADHHPLSAGVGGMKGNRNSPPVFNRALSTMQFWDGRAASLEDQALGPIANPVEMNLPVDEAVARLRASRGYRQAFQKAFKGEPSAPRLAEALAAYQRTLFAVDSSYDRFEAGDSSALSASAQRGLELFGGKAHCGDCHAGPNFTDELFHTLGHGEAKEPGRMAVSGQPVDAGSFKTPTLRQLTQTGPYMHDGSLTSLRQVVDFYDQGCAPHPNLSSKIRKLGLSEAEKTDLIAFLESLTGTVVEYAAAPTPGRSGR
jgi:cytochrome c peroxidase